MISSPFLILFLGTNAALATTTTYASRLPESMVEPALTAILSAEATQKTLSPTSNVQGAAFDKFHQIWLENTDAAKADADPNWQWLASQGISLTNYYATTHPSEPNYCAVVAGDNFGMDADDFNAIPSNISTIVDLLDTKGISWAEYQEAIPYAGFQGYNFSNQVTYANDYVRKHDPLILFESVTNNATRLELIKSFDSFASDLAAKTLPQWSFITPNMTDDGHDSTITFAANWARTFLEPLLNNTYFMDNTLVLLTFDETETYIIGNKVSAILLGGAIPTSLHGTTDNTFYNHYSTLSTVEVNWGLPSLGRWDCGANVFSLVANKTGYDNYVVDTSNVYFNSSYPGPLSDGKYVPIWPVPDTNAKCASGQGVLNSIVTTWGKSDGTYNYTFVYPYDDESGTNVGGSAALETASSSTISTATSTSTSSSTSPSASKKSAASSGRLDGMSFYLAGCVFMVAAILV